MGTTVKGWRGAFAAALVFALLLCCAPPALAVDIYSVKTPPTAEGKEGDKLRGYTISGGVVQVTPDDGTTYKVVPGKFYWADPDGQTPTKTSRTFVADFFPDAGGGAVTSTSIEVKVNSTTPASADEINRTVPTADNIDALRTALAACPNKNRIYESTIINMDRVYRAKYGYIETVTVTDSNATSNRLPDYASSYGAAMAAQAAANVRIYQERTSGSAVLQFDVALNGSTSLATPIVLVIGMPNGWNNSRDYYLRGSYNSPSVNISRNGGDRYYLTFTTDSLGTFKLFRDSDSSSRHDDDDYDVPSFWIDVMDEIYDAERDDYIRVNAGNRTTVPAEVLRELRGRDVTLALRRSGKSTITIYGKDIKTVPSDLEYYTMTSLAKRYGTAETSPSEPPASSAPPAYVPPPAPPVYVPPVYQPPVYVAPKPAPVSSAAASSGVPEPEVVSEVLAVEDSSSEPESEPESSLPEKVQESTGSAPADPLTFGLFVVLVLALTAVASVGITLVVWSRRQ